MGASTLRNPHAAVPATRVAALLRYAQHARALGAPVDTLLARSAIPERILEHPEAAVPLDNAFRFGELVCSKLGTAHLGIEVGLMTLLEDLGAYGRLLRNSVTLGDYFRQGIALYGMLTTGQRLWLSDDGQALRLNVATVGKPRLGPTSRNWRSWSSPWPRAGRENLSAKPEQPSPALIPERFGGLVQLQIEHLLPARGKGGICRRIPRPDQSQPAAKAAGRGAHVFALAGRLPRASGCRVASPGGKPTVPIARDLGYNDHSNFTRAFRRRAGVSPAAFRSAAVVT